MNKIKHFLQFNDFEKDEIELLFDRAKWIRPIQILQKILAIGGQNSCDDL